MAVNPVKSLPTLNEIIEDTPLVVTTTIAKARLIGETYPYRWVLSYSVRVRSMGTATYIALGNEQAQESRLVSVGDVYQYACSRYEVIDLTKKWIRADTADAIVEVSASWLPVRLYGNVNMADRQG